MNNKNKLKVEIIRFLKCINLVLMAIPFVGIWYGHYIRETYLSSYERNSYLIIVLFVILYCIYAKLYDALQVSIARIRNMVYSQVISVFITDSIVFVVIWLLSHDLPSILPMLLVFFVQVIMATVWSWGTNRWYFLCFPPRKTAVIYDKRVGVEDLIKQYYLDRKFDITCVVRVDQCLDNNMEDLNDVENVFLCGIHSHERNIILKYCIMNSISTYVFPRIGDILMSSAKSVHIMHLPILRVVRYSPPFEYIVVKRIMDIAISGVAMIAFSPVVLLTAIAIKVSDGGPVFYQQVRLTQNGKLFKVLKFRSMCIDAEKDGVARLSTGDQDSRITPIGKIIRKVRIDELPQLINIIKGDMTIVGPRPERPEIAKQYEYELPEFSLRLQAKAGLTGLAQVYGKYNTTPYDKLQMDLMYIANPSIMEDLKIMFATIKILFSRESTEGVKIGQDTSLED